MIAFQNYTKLLADFGELLGFPEALTPDEDGVGTLVLDESIQITLTCVPGNGALLHAFCPLGNAPRETSEQVELYRELLQKTRQLYLGHGASVALEPQSGELVFNVSTGLADLTSAQFEDFLDQILQTVSPLISRLNQPAPTESDPNAQEIPGAWTRV
jgi:hypothetical protein